MAESLDLFQLMIKYFHAGLKKQVETGELSLRNEESAPLTG